MSELDIDAIRARARNLADVRAARPANFADLEPEQLRGIAQGYAEDVPALLDRIFESEERLTDMDAAHSREAREHGAQIRRAEAAEERIAALEQVVEAATDEIEMEREHLRIAGEEIAQLKARHAAAKAIVRAVAESRVLDISNKQLGEVVGEAIILPAEIRDQARALLAGETRKEAGE